MFPAKESPVLKKGSRTNSTNHDILDLADKASSEENLSLSSDDLTGESLISTSSDIGFKSQEDGYLLGSYPEVFKEMTQPMSLEQNAPDSENIFAVNICTDRTDSIGSYNLDSILYQFDNFFRHKLDSELQVFQESMHAMLTEQQIHIQRIFNPSAEQSFNEAHIQPPDAVSVESSHNSTRTTDTRCICHDSESKVKMGLIMELLSLSAQISALLHLPKFS